MIELSVENGVAEVVLNAPEKLNALDPAGIAELSDAYGEAERMSQAGEVRALVLRGEGRAFCAGRDISGVDPREDDVLGYLGGLVEPLLRRMAAFPAPTFAVAHGACLGVGLGLLIASDIVYVADTAKIGSPFANLGATLDSGGHALFVERLGAHKTMDLIVTGRLMSGYRGGRGRPVLAGLPGRRGDGCHPRRGPRRGIRGHPGVPRLEARSSPRSATSGSDSGQSMDEENRAQAALCDTADYREGFAAFQEKRKPEFTGRG